MSQVLTLLALAKMALNESGIDVDVYVVDDDQTEEVMYKTGLLSA